MPANVPTFLARTRAKFMSLIPGTIALPPPMILIAIGRLVLMSVRLQSMLLVSTSVSTRSATALAVLCSARLYVAPSGLLTLTTAPSSRRPDLPVRERVDRRGRAPAVV